jgi:hypothetical protein
MHIGGYGQIPLKKFDYIAPNSVIKLQSARSCLYLFLKSISAKVIYLPSYICDSIFPALEDLNIVIRRYNLNDHLLPSYLPELANDEYFLIVNYFGLLAGQIDLLQVNKKQVIVDNSQAFFANTFGFAASIYSLRKFFPVPDGGYLVSDIDHPQQLEQYNGEEHLKHIVLRGAGLVEEGYAHFLEAEMALCDFNPKFISKISDALMKTIDIENVKLTRRNNFLLLDERLKSINEFDFPLGKNDVPLCYPLLLDFEVSKLHKKLVDKKIFTPRYWPNILNNYFYEHALFIPLDERIGKKEIDFIIAILQENIEILK